MHILINITSCLTLIGQAWTKTAFGVTLLKLSNKWQQYVLWFCIVTMNAYMLAKVILQWGQLCDEKSYKVWYRLNFCVQKKWRDDFKEGGNSECFRADPCRACLVSIANAKDGSLQHRHGLCLCSFPLDHYMEVGHSQAREDHSLRHNELGNVHRNHLCR
jgi:hypothetical protein